MGSPYKRSISSLGTTRHTIQMFLIMLSRLLGPSRGAEHCDQSVCLSVCLRAYLVPLDRSSWNFVCSSHVAVARSSFGNVAICYVLPVLCMMSRVAIRSRWQLAALRYRDEVYGCLVSNCFCVNGCDKHCDKQTDWLIDWLIEPLLTSSSFCLLYAPL